MIVNLNIENFRGIKKLFFDEFKRINIFVGKNNSGKTSILESLFLNIGAINPELAPRINAFREHNKIDDSTFRAFFYNFTTKNPIRIETEVKNPKQYRYLSISPNKTSNSSEKILSITDIESHENTSLNSKEIIGLESLLKFKESYKGNFKEYKSYIKKAANGLEILQPQNYEEKIRGVFIQPRKFILDNAVRLSKVKLLKKEDKIINILRSIEPNLKRLEILENNIIYADISKNNLIPFSLLGDGINRLLAIILAIFENENGIVLIDEIENGFHYEALRTLWLAVIEIAKEHNVQIFATTHSWENIATFTQIYTEMNYADLMLYRIESDINESKAIKYNNELLYQTLESDWELR